MSRPPASQPAAVSHRVVRVAHRLGPAVAAAEMAWCTEPTNGQSNRSTVVPAAQGAALNCAATVQVSRGLQLQPLWRTPTAAVS